MLLTRDSMFVERAMTRLNVLITSSYYWPEDAGSAPYLTGLAEHLSARGHDVVVATGFPHYPEWRSSARGRLAAEETHNGVRIRRRWHYVPSAQSAAQRATYELSLLGFGLTAFPRRWRADVVVGTCPSVAGGALAAAAATRYRAPFGLVFQDLVGRAAAQSGVAGGARVAGLVRRIELSLAKRAAGVAIIAEGFRRYLKEGGVPPGKIHRLRNWTRRVEPTETSPDTRRRFGWAADDFVCVHGGNMGHKQGLDNLLNTASLLGENRVRIALVGDGNDRERLERQAHDRSLANVDFIAMQGPGNWEATMQAADVLLVNQRASVTDMSLPSKLTSYFASGRPVIAAASPDSETAAEIGAAGAGLVVPPADPGAFRDAILALEHDRPRAQALGTSGKGYAESTLSRASALAEYEDFVDGLVNADR
jgi:glycosyltransferase involved in cell wall biosynthesis